MKQILLLLTITLFILPEMVYSQDRNTLRAANRSFNSAQDNYKDGNYQKAIQEYKIVINTVPANIDSRSDLTNRLDALIDLIDIYFYKYVNITNACEYIDVYIRDMNTVRAGGVLRTAQLLDYQRKEQEYIADYKPKCESYDGVGDDMDKFRRKIDFDDSMFD